jgi:hypothetical protein
VLLPDFFLSFENVRMRALLVLGECIGASHEEWVIPPQSLMNCRSIQNR